MIERGVNLPETNRTKTDTRALETSFDMFGAGSMRKVNHVDFESSAWWE